MAQALSTATFNDTYAGPTAMRLVAVKVRGATGYRWDAVSEPYITTGYRPFATQEAAIRAISRDRRWQDVAAPTE